MTFSIQHNPYFPMYPHVPYNPTDPVMAQKALALRQGLNPRPPVSHGMELISSLLATYSPNKLPRQDTHTQQKLAYPPLNPLFTPGWFHQALAATLQTGAMQLLRQLPEDLSMPVPSPRSTEISPTMAPKVHGKLPPSPAVAGFKRKPTHLHHEHSQRSDKDRFDSLLYSQPTFYPILKDQVEKAHQSWRTSDVPKPPNTSHAHETGTLVPSLIDGEIIMGFNVWGEKRLCLPHLFRFVLNDVDLKSIDEACTKLQITCTTCSPAQLTLLHSRKILPQAVSSCGLIRKSDAERLTKFIRNRLDAADKSSALGLTCSVSVVKSRCSRADFDVEDGELDLRKPKDSLPKSKNVPASTEVEGSARERKRSGGSSRSDITRQLTTSNEQLCDDDLDGSPSSSESIPVLHECFGRQLGLIHPNLYVETTSKCIECQTCHRLFAPDQFVGHTHTVTEVDNLNHWGFDSSNWRCYLRLYSGRRSRPSRSSPHRLHQQDNSASDDDAECDTRNSSEQSVVNAQAHRRLEEFKIKFAQPIRLPASLSAALRTVGLCASVAPIPPPAALTEISPPVLDMGVSSRKSSFISPKVQISRESIPPVSGSSTLTTIQPSAASLLATNQPNSTSIPNVMLPQLTLRRLWAPNDGRIKVPPPPRPMVSRDTNVLPKRLHTGPPLLLHSHRVVSQAAADRYDRDFIPNVCLMPPLKSKSGNIPRRYRYCSQSRGKRTLHRTRNLSSGSRSRSDSEYSSGSSSSRTRSISMSSTSSSSCSYDRAVKRQCNGLNLFSPIHDTSRRSSTPSSNHSLRVDDDPKALRLHRHKSTSPLKPRSLSLNHRTRMRSHSQHSESAHSDSAVRMYNRQLLKAKRRRCRSWTIPFNPADYLIKRPIRGSSYSEAAVMSSRPASTRFRKPHEHEKHTTVSKSSRRYKKSDSPSQSYRECMQRQDRALAAAKAAQGAASRICPGLWSRHFTNLNGPNSGLLDLPNARDPQTMGDTESFEQQQLKQSRTHMSNTPVLVTSPTKNSLPTAVLALEAIWADLVRHINEYTTAVESKCDISDARQRLFEQFITMQTCYATHIAALMSENQKLNEKLSALQRQPSASSANVPTPTVDQTNQMELASNWNRNAAHPRPDFSNYTPEADNAPVVVDVRQLPSPQTNTSSHPIYPHRSRKEPSRIMAENRSANFPMRLAQPQTERQSTIGFKDIAKTNPLDNSKASSSGSYSSSAVLSTEKYLEVCSEDRLTSGLNCTVSCPSETTLTSTKVPNICSEGDGLVHERQLMDTHNSCKSNSERRSTSSSNSSSSGSSCTSSSSNSSISPGSLPAKAGKPAKQTEDVYSTADPLDEGKCKQPAEDNKDSVRAFSDNSVPHHPLPPKRRALLPPCDDRPRLSVKTQLS
ncbi:hypothetical protein PHET_05505 [Paragonimus heterotremus]|uniref:c-SKI SMAD4-binding domain-containing protein n=1 Tax=Paragonimus heterotremus TaxID=100268 RepID=A0A8J4WRJ5_9TREM|nr:hypothetical protein PHET_05505 [Paragonimus heterotremus]